VNGLNETFQNLSLDFSEYVPRNLGQGDVVNDGALHFAVYK